MVRNELLVSKLNDNYSFVDTKNGWRFLYRKFQRRVTRSEVDDLLERKGNDYIYNFIITMNENNKGKYMENFYSNLKNCKIADNTILQKLFFNNELFGGSRITKRNLYLLLEDKTNQKSLTPYHELLHLLTTIIKDENTVLIGLQYNDFGKGLNEGYTELLTKRYFSHLTEDNTEIYPSFTWFLDMIEEIVGQERLEDHFFSCDLNGLIKDLTQYCSEKKALKLIHYMDELFDNEEALVNEQKRKKYDAEEINRHYQTNCQDRMVIYYIILSIYKNKQFDLLYNDKITHEEYKKRIEEFKRKNDEILNTFSKEDIIYRDFFREEQPKKKVRGKKNGTTNNSR